MPEKHVCPLSLSCIQTNFWKIVLHALTNINIQDAKAITTSKDTKKTLKLVIMVQIFVLTIFDIINGIWQLWKKLCIQK